MMRVFLSAIALGLSPLCLAQIGSSGSITGTISDPTGAVIPGASVTATNVATGVKTTRQTTATGVYLLTPLPAGEYSVSASATGFQPVIQQQVIVDSVGSVGLNLTLQVGATNEAVTVTAAPPQLNTVDARLGQTMRNEMYTALPLSMGGAPRNPQAFAFLLPGVQEGGRWGYVNGGQSFSKDVYIEGLPITDAVQQGEGRALTLGVSVEAVEQFQVETSGQSVEFNGQGSENYTIKSGTNDFHGSAYDYFRNTKLDARGFFAPVRQAENQNEFGFTIGGPIRRNNLFFFGSYDGYRFRRGTPFRFLTIPTARMRAGDFVELPVGVFDPRTTACATPPCTRQVFPGNVIPASRISPISRFFQDPLPQPTHSGIAQNYLGNNAGVGFNNDNTNIKVDYNASDAHRFSVLFSRGRRSQSNEIRGDPPPLPLPYTETRIVDEVPTVGQVKHNWVVTPSLLNQMTFGASRLYVPITNPTIGGNWAERAGIRGLPPGDATQSFPETSFAGPNSPQNWRGTNARPFLDALNNFTFQESLQWIKMNHSFKFGFQHQRLQDNFRDRWDGTLFIARFSNTETAGFSPAGTLQTGLGNSYASYLLGALDSAAVTEDFVVTSGARFRNYAFWAGDDYRVTQRLTLNLGLRWDFMLPYVEAVDRMSWMNPDLANPAAGGRPGALQFAGSGDSPLYCNCRTNIKNQYTNFGPRAGFAYRVRNNTVVRAGYGIMYSRHGAVGGRGGARDGTGKLGYTAAPGFNTLDAGITPAFYWDNGVPSYERPPFISAILNTGFTNERPSGGSVTFGNPEEGARPPRYQNWNFSIQQALGAANTLTIGYSGSNGKLLRGGGRGIWSSQMHPQYLALGNLLRAQATPANIAAAQAIVPGVALPFANFRGAIGQMLLPFPQYAGVGAPYNNVASSNYNSLQVTLARRMTAGLTLNLNYTFSKTLTDAQGGRTEYFWAQEKTLGEANQKHVFNGVFVYELPFRYAANRGVNALVSGWRLSGITRVRSGLPYGTIAANCNVPFAGACHADFNPAFTGSVRINGDWGSGDLLGARPRFLEPTAFRNPDAFTYGNTPRTGAFGLTNPAFWNQDISVMRQFAITERVKLNFQADAFNMFNTVIFNGPASLNINNANFGRVTGQANDPRIVQLSLKLQF
jgi:hypothetical protein